MTTTLIKCFLLTCLLLVKTVFASADAQIYDVDKILKIEINSSINPATLNYLHTAYKKAEHINANLILLKLNTPGGLVTTTKDILTLIGASDIPIIIWVTPEGASATSAGAIIASAAHGLFMSEGTNIGAATPISGGGKNISKDLRSKAINDLVALVSSLSEARGRNASAFAEMIEKAKSFKGQEALKKNLIDGIAMNQTDLLSQLQGRQIKVKGKVYTLAMQSPEFIHLSMDLGQKILDIFANPSMAYILFLIGAALLYLELQAPGGFIAGSIGLVLLLLAGIGFQVLPLNFGALGLIALSFVLFILEMYITSYGILSLAGLASLIIGSLFLFRTDNAYIEFSHTVVASAISSIALFLGIILYFLLKDIRQQKEVGDFNLLTGKPATVLADLGDVAANNQQDFLYQVKVSGEIWQARSSQQLELGSHVVIKEHNQKDLILKI